MALGLDGEGDHRCAPRAGGDPSADWADGAHAPGPGEMERRKWLSAAPRDLVIYEEQLLRAIWTRNFRKHILCGGAGSVGALPGRREGIGGRPGVEATRKGPRWRSQTQPASSACRHFGQDPHHEGPQFH